MSEIEERLQKLPEGERRIHDLLLSRLEAGLQHYGAWKINRDPRSMPAEALDEILDCLHYCAVELLRLRDEADARRAQLDLVVQAMKDWSQPVGNPPPMTAPYPKDLAGQTFSWADATLTFSATAFPGCPRYYCPRCESWYTVGPQGSQACPQCAVADFKTSGIEPAPSIRSALGQYADRSHVVPDYDRPADPPNRTDPSYPDRSRHYCAGCDRWFDEHDCPRCGSALP